MHDPGWPSDEQVEAAARALHAWKLGHGLNVPRSWGHVSDEGKREYCSQARAALSAVSPPRTEGPGREAELRASLERTVSALSWLKSRFELVLAGKSAREVEHALVGAESAMKEARALMERTED